MSTEISSAVLVLDCAHTERRELQLPPVHRLECLNGRHRVQGGEGDETPPQLWWTVDLVYIPGRYDLLDSGLSRTSHTPFSRFKRRSEKPA